MIRSFRAEMARLARPRVLPRAALAALVFAVGGAFLVMVAAQPAAESPGQGLMPTLESLSTAGGGTEVMRSAAAFSGTLVFGVLVGVFALEFSRGTYRTMLFKQPRRTHLLLGRLGALLAFAAAGLACIELLMWVTARFLAPSNDVATDAWNSGEAVVSALGDFGSVLVWITGYTVYALLIAILLRSVPLALGFGIAWAGPFEHLVGDAWSTGQQVFPGLLLEAVGQGGTPEVSANQALLTSGVYIVAALSIAAVVFSRRDVTG